LTHLDAHRPRYEQGNGREVARLFTTTITAYARRTESLAATGAALTREADHPAASKTWLT